MRFGMHLHYQYLNDLSDAEKFIQETKLAIEAEAMGFDYVGPVEHHFTTYAACPAPFEMLSYVAAKTSKIQLITGAVILPWNNPLRVVEQAIQLDILSEGRLILGMGRGAARREFASFGLDLKDSREMFDESALIIRNALETGFVEADSRWYQIPRTEIRPRSFKSFKDRMVMVAMSPSSMDVAARYGFQMLRFSQGSWDGMAPEIERYRDTFRAHNDHPVPPLVISDFVVCFNDPKKVVEYTDKYFGLSYKTIANHYEFGGEHFKDLPSYAAYAAMGEAAKAAGGVDQAYKDYIGANLIGTPEQILEYHQARSEVLGDYDIFANFSFGGMPYELVYEQAKLFADKVMPKLRG